MSRQRIDDGRWFNLSKAKHYEEATRWNGNNHVSLATGSQWEHERLYRTAGGIWILNHWSQWQGSTESWEEIDADAAARWLIANNHDHPACEAEIAALEIA